MEALAQVITLYLIAEHLSVVAHADPTWLRLPDVPVGVRLAVRRAALVVTTDLAQDLGHRHHQQ